jgi:hypothetical protein
MCEREGEPNLKKEQKFLIESNPIFQIWTLKPKLKSGDF